MMYKFLFPLIGLISLVTIGLAQQTDLERFLEQQNEYSDISDLVDWLDELEKNPIDLNQATARQLANLPWISEVLAVAIIDYRNQNGRFHSIEELQKIKNIDPELISIISRYVTVPSRKMEKTFSLSTKTRLSRKLEKCEGFKKGTYYPSPDKIYNRFTLKYGSNFRFGMLLEKDSGERNLNDLGLYFLSYRNSSMGNEVILGNYRLELGQGLIFGNPYGYYKGNDPIYAARRQGKELLEYQLVDENASLYGITGKFCFKIYQVCWFLSSTKLDATLNPDQTVQSLYNSGYHRNVTEINKKDQLNERLAGARVGLNTSVYFSLGMTYYRSLFNHSGVLKSSIPSDDFSPNSKRNDLKGIDCNLTLGPFNLFGEAALSQHNEFGLMTGVFMDSRPLEFVILARNYSKNFISLHGYGFGECGDHPQNERGIYVGFQFNPLKTFQFDLYFDHYKFPWRTYFVPMPSRGKDLLLSIEHHPINKLSVLFHFKVSQKDCFKSDHQLVVPRNQYNIRFQVEYHFWSAIKVRHRIEQVRVSYLNYNQLHDCHSEAYNGLLLYQDMTLQLKNNLNIAARITFFDTDGYESRLYQFEHDVPGMLTNQMLYGMGNRSYIKLQWEIKSNIKISLKLASVQYHHVNSIGSNEDMIIGNTLNTFNFQIESHW